MFLSLLVYVVYISRVEGKFKARINRCTSDTLVNRYSQKQVLYALHMDTVLCTLQGLLKLR